MGFSVYWTRIPTTGAVFRRFVEDLKKVVRYSNIEITPDGIKLEDRENRSETFYTDISGKAGFGFCKTGRSYFTYDVMDACLIMDYYKMIVEYSNDDEDDFPWHLEKDRVRDILQWDTRVPEDVDALKARIAQLETQLEDARLLAEKILSVTRQ